MNIAAHAVAPERATTHPVPLPFEFWDYPIRKKLADMLPLPAYDQGLWQSHLDNPRCLIYPFSKRVRIPVILSYGMGVDSSVIFFKFLLDPSWRDFDLQDLVLIISQLGSEWEETKKSVVKWVFPLARQYGIRIIQGARAGESALDGVVILDDTRSPRTFYGKGAYKLRDSLLYNGTVPQVAAGRRLCTQKYKGWVIDFIVRLLFNDSPARRLIGYNADEVKRMGEVQPQQGYRYILGFNGDEESRVVSEADNTRKQVFEFTLIEKGWGRVRCEEYLWDLVHEKWHKSFCKMCCFSMCTGGRENLETGFLKHPDAGFDAAEVELNALAANPTQLLYGRNETVLQVLARTGNETAIALVEEHLEHWQDWGIYVVRRLFPHDKGVVRQTKIIYRGTQQQSISYLQDLAHAYELEPQLLRYFWRFWSLPPSFLQTRKKPMPWQEELFKRHKRQRPSGEEMFVVCPLKFVERQGDLTEEEFARRWRGVLGDRPMVRAVQTMNAS